MMIDDTSISLGAYLLDYRPDIDWTNGTSSRPSRLDVNIYLDVDKEGKIFRCSGAIKVHGNHHLQERRYELPWKDNEKPPQWLREDVAELLKSQGENIIAAVMDLS
ncbi:hypothetical protein [Rhodococcus qingshengii]|uniref:hypothetical protein n=1 Tax=Rhodococcus qingshengii TaxID=334542 RepID=UPI0035D54507